VDGFAKAESGYDIYAHAAECIEQINALSSLASLLDGCTQLIDLCDQKALGVLDGSRREGAIKHILTVLGFSIREKTKAGSVFAEALIQRRFLVPAILVVVDIVVGFGVGKVELRMVSTRGATNK
jgi:hypothetical protein